MVFNVRGGDYNVPYTLQEMSEDKVEIFAHFPQDLKDGFMANVPSVPGNYRFIWDSASADFAVWVLTNDGHWVDETGNTYDPEWNWILGLGGKWERVS